MSFLWNLPGECCEKVGRLGKSGWSSDVPSSAPPSSPSSTLKTASGLLEAGSGAERQYKWEVWIGKAAPPSGGRTQRHGCAVAESEPLGLEHFLISSVSLLSLPLPFHPPSYESCYSKCACLCAFTCVCVRVCVLMRALNSSLRAAADLWTSRCLHHLLSCSL